VAETSFPCHRLNQQRFPRRCALSGDHSGIGGEQRSVSTTTKARIICGQPLAYRMAPSPAAGGISGSHTGSYPARHTRRSEAPCRPGPPSVQIRRADQRRNPAGAPCRDASRPDSSPIRLTCFARTARSKAPGKRSPCSTPTADNRRTSPASTLAAALPPRIPAMDACVRFVDDDRPHALDLPICAHSSRVSRRTDGLIGRRPWLSPGGWRAHVLAQRDHLRVGRPVAQRHPVRSQRGRRGPVADVRPLG
jgi:hypothetical protein